MKTIKLLALFILLIFIACGESEPKADKISEGVYSQNGWTYDMKYVNGDKKIIPFYNISTISKNTLTVKNESTEEEISMKLKVKLVLNKTGDNKGKVSKVLFETTNLKEKEFSFPRCLSVCPFTIDVLAADGSTTEEFKSSYSRNNYFEMKLEDGTLLELIEKDQKVRVRVPIQILQQNTTFNWFIFDFKAFDPTLH